MESESTSTAPWKGLAEVAAALSDDALLAGALTRVVDAFVSSGSSSVSSEKEAVSALESAVALSGALRRLEKHGELAPKLAAAGA